MCRETNDRRGCASKARRRFRGAPGDKVMQLRWLVSIPLLSVSLEAAAAPAVAPKDARGSFAVYCEAVCGAVSLPGWDLVEKLPEDATKPSYSTALYGTEFGMPDAATLAAWGIGDVAGAANAKAVVVVSWAGP